jgi:hypothetical protein
MRQFDVYRNPSQRSAPLAPFVVVMQSHLLAAMPTVLAAPMFRAERRVAYTYVSVALSFRSEALVVSLAEMAALDTQSLREKLGDLRNHEDDIRRALGRVFTGF